MTIVWLKLLHVATLSVWAGGLLLMPLLLGQRQAVGDGAPLHRLHAFTRFAYITVISPAAFLAIASGTALIFQREVVSPWFAAKLVLVGILVALHVWIGLVVLSVFEPEGRFARWRVGASVTALALVMTGIVWVVLAKPELPLGAIPEVFFQPGGLRALAAEFIPGLTP